jgi:cell division protein ZapA (FtsZ GTPase activity inhibitor)
VPNLTTDQVDELADQVLSLKKAVNAFRNTYFNTLTPDQRDGLQTLAAGLGDLVDHLTAVAIKLSLADVQQSLSHLRDITAGVNEAVAHLGEVRKVLTVATSLVGLGAAIVTANPVGILSALNDTAAAIRG